jgi:hypothetical protein
LKKLAIAPLIQIFDILSFSLSMHPSLLNRIEVSRSFVIFHQTMRIKVAILLSVLSPTVNAVSDDAKFYTTYKPAGLQSGPDATGSTFVSAAIYNEDENSVIFTGSTWGRFFESPEQLLDEDFDIFGDKMHPPDVLEGCFLATATLPATTVEQQSEYDTLGLPPGVFWSHRQRLSDPSANEACNAVHLFEESGTVLVAGHTEERLNVTVRTGVLQEKTVQSGLLMAEEWDTESDDMYIDVGGQLLQNETLTYPSAITSRSGSLNDGLFVVFMDASNKATHVDLVEGQQPHDPANYFDYGTGYGFSVGRFDFAKRQVSVDTTATVIKQSWIQPYDTDEFKGQVYVNDILKVANGLLVVVGATNGQGRAFGAQIDQGKDMDGFLAKISPSNGQLIIEPGFPSSYRIQSNNKKHGNDWAMAICNDPNDTQHHVYIAGTTEGVLPETSDSVSGTSAFLMKYDVRHMKAVWTKQLGAETTTRRHETIVRGMACAVTPDGTSVWLGGTVDEGAVIPQSGLKQAFGGRDIFVAVMDTTTGTLQWVKQLGSAKDDELAIRGGLVTDSAGNAVLVGNTYGSFYRTRAAHETASDVFVLTVALFDGQTVNSITNSASPIKKQTSNSMSATGIVLAVCLSSVVITAALYLHHKSVTPSMTDRSHVISYMRRFDVKDVELKHSATGGWHCTFVNRLADGEFTPANDGIFGPRPPLNARKSANRSNVFRREKPSGKTTNDYLFCDTVDFEDAVDVDGQSNGGLLHGGKPGSAYEDLVEAYNSTWASHEQFSDRPGSVGTSRGKDII